MDPRESHSLVVGQPPIPGELEWATSDDVSDVDIKPNENNQVPEMRTGGNVPLILPTRSWGEKAQDD